MKTINVTFTDEEYEQLMIKKNGVNGKTWHDFLIENTVKDASLLTIDEAGKQCTNCPGHLCLEG